MKKILINQNRHYLHTIFEEYLKLLEIALMGWMGDYKKRNNSFAFVLKNRWTIALKGGVVHVPRTKPSLQLK